MSALTRRKPRAVAATTILSELDQVMQQRRDVVREAGAPSRHVQPDPDAPQQAVSRGRARDHLRDLWTAGDLSTTLWIAAERYRDDYEASSGARTGDGNMGIRSCHAGIADTVLDALRRVRHAQAAMGGRLHRMIVDWCLIQNEMAPEFGGSIGRRAGLGKRLLFEALESLDRHYAESA